MSDNRYYVKFSKHPRTRPGPFIGCDAFAGSLAVHENATLVTADYDFKSVPSGTIKIEFLPDK